MHSRLILTLLLAATASLPACGRNDRSATSGTTSGSQGTATPTPAPPPPATAPTPAPAPVTTAPAAPAADAGSSSSTASTAGPTTGSATTAAAGANGQTVYATTCVACHGAGVAGAPKLGDKADWGPRIAKGNDLLYTHALNGFTGAKGVMPPKGGNTSLPDADVRAAVDYMVSQAK